MSRTRSHRRPTAPRPARPPSPRELAELEALRAELRERYDFFQAQRERAAAAARETTRDIVAG